MLMDERMRCENHRINYQTLKAEHTRCVCVMCSHLVNRKLTYDYCSVSLCMAVFLSSVPVCTAVGLFCKVLTPQRLDPLLCSLQETEEYRSEYNKLRYDYTFLKSEFDHQREESARILEEKKIRFDAEVDRAELMAQYQGTDLSRDCKRIESLLREKAQLHLRLKVLEADVAELRAQRDNSGQQAENVQHIQVRQFAESQAAAKSLEAERQSLRLQSERLGRELQLSHEQNTQLTGRLHKAEREVYTLTSQVIILVTHFSKLFFLPVSLLLTPTFSLSPPLLPFFSGCLSGMQSDVEVLKGTVERQEEVLAEREGELVRRVQAAHDEEFHKTATVHEEKLVLDDRLAELEQQRALQDAAGHTQKEECEERLHGAQLGEESARKELQNLRTKLQEQGSQLEEMETQKRDNADLRRQNQELGLQLGTLSHSEAELLESNQCLRETLERAREDLRSARSQAERTQHEAERLVEERCVEGFEEKHKLQERDAELQEKYGLAKLQRAALTQEKGTPPHLHLSSLLSCSSSGVLPRSCPPQQTLCSSSGVLPTDD
uniref:Centrosomal protein 83 n=1 Tax=Oncorhynchus tshawytscha TaxID=74940 RepID=A0A8C8D787_ONCTS